MGGMTLPVTLRGVSEQEKRLLFIKAIRNLLVDKNGYYAISQREIEVGYLAVVEMMPDKEISARLDIAPGTVSVHVRKLSNKIMQSTCGHPRRRKGLHPLQLLMISYWREVGRMEARK